MNEHHLTKFIASVLLVCCCLTVHAKGKTLSVNVQNATLRQVFGIIEKQTDYRVSYRNVFIDEKKDITINQKGTTVDKVLDAALIGRSLTYSIVPPKTIIISDKTAPRRTAATSPQQADGKVRGTVTDANGEPIIGASVRVKGSTTGTVTDVNGNYSLQAGRGDIIEVSYVGFGSKEVKVAGPQADITMVEDEQSLDELVVIGYGTVKKSDLTGAVASVSNRQFKDQPIKQADQVLQGRMAGVVATSYTGQIGQSLNVRVRGVSSINFGNDPLWVTDGVIGSAPSNPDDIESIEVLKDASSTAIYGSRGANGVVMVTTKHGEAGKPRVEFSTQIGLSNIDKKYDLMGPYEYARALSELTSNSFTTEQMQAFKDGTAGYDFYDLMLHTGVAQDYKVNISGGTKKTNYLVSGQYLNQTAITKTSKLRRFAFRANLNTEVTPWLSITSDIQASTQKSHNIGRNDVDLFEMVNWSPVVVPMTDENGVYARDPYSSISNNPYGELMLNDNDSRVYNVLGHVDLKFNIMKGLTFTTMGSVSFNNTSAYSFESSKARPTGQSEMSNSMARNLTYQWTNNLTYKHDFGEHHLTGTTVWEVYKTHYENVGVNGTDLLNELTGYWNINAISSAIKGSTGFVNSQMLSWLARVQYDYANKYYLTAAIRADGSSKFQHNKWGWFPSVAAAWNIAQEDFMKDQDIFQQLKLRATFGVSGNQAISSYATLGSMTLASYAYGTGSLYSGYWQSELGSPDLTWEKTYQYDLGLDVSVLNSRLGFTFDWYLKKTKDLLFEKTIPYYAGGGTYWDNVGSMRSYGVEFAVNGVPVQTRDFVWQSSLNATYLKTKVTSLGGDPFLIPDAGKSGIRSGDAYIIKEGLPVSNFHIWKWLGFDESGNNLYQTADGGSTTNPTDADRIITGNPIPKWTFGWNNTFQYKRWEANVFFRASTGFQRLNIINYALSNVMSQGLFIRTREAYYRNWDKVYDKSHAKYPSLKSSLNYNTPRSTQWLEDADFLRLQNISISYTFPKQWTKICDIALGFSAQNLFTITGYSGYDPEATSSVDGDRVVGLDDNTYPSPRTYTFTAKFIF